MTPKRVLLRIKKLRRFLDERIGDAAREREGAEDAETRAEADGRLAAYQEVRDEMIGERLDLDEVELEPEVGADGPAEAGPSDRAEGEGDEPTPEEAEEAEETRAGG